MEKDYLIQKWLNDELTPAEKIAFEQSEDFALHQAIIDQAQNYKASHVVQPLTYETIKSQLSSTPDTATKPQRLWMRYAAAAVVALVLLAGYYVGFSSTTKRFETEIAQTETVQLPDQSNVILNAKSSLTYSTKDWKNNRVLQLNGEAFFDVEKGSTFSVETALGAVTVLGTEFNVKQRDGIFEVTCYEGKVAVTRGDERIILLPGDAAFLNNNVLIAQKISVTTPSWRNNFSTFTNVPVGQVLDELQRQYAVQLTLTNVDTEIPFKGSFEHTNLKQALQAITEPLGLTFTMHSAFDVTISKQAQ